MAEVFEFTSQREISIESVLIDREALCDYKILIR